MKRRAIVVTGVVQGVGFRPFVQTLAGHLDLSGFVQNRAGTVLIEVEGDDGPLDTFVRRLQTESPVLARIDDLKWEPKSVRGERGFRIEASGTDAFQAVFVSPDVATCQQCRKELFDRADPRYRYPFLNCTNCGPRLTIIRRAPYDRINTTMVDFPMCARCREEYDDPADRRFHAQPAACPECGPRLTLLDANGLPIPSDDPLRDFADAICNGKTGSLKGLGGYHLVCLATSDDAVKALRQRKQRCEKPFAVMVRDTTAAEYWCTVDDEERRLLSSVSRPIVLLRKKPGSARHGHDAIREDVAPRNPCLGVMLPYTPLHELLMELLGDRPLVMTSGNRSDEPIAYQDDDAIKRLGGIADLFLTHNRPIHVRCDDSVTRVIAGKESPVRRSRGYAPMPIKLPFQVRRPILAVGGQLKSVFALARGSNAFLSHHMGDLDHLDAFQAFQRDIDLYEQLFQITPESIVHDQHPDYASTRYAQQRGSRDALPCFGVQHHHAHLASCMAEHGIDGEVIGVTFDGGGLGTDGTIWGGEFLVGGYESFRRAGYLRPVRLPGGDTAIRQTWRMALSYLIDAGCAVDDAVRHVDASSIRVVRHMIEQGFNAPWTSSVGRLFDAVAAILSVRQTVSFEGQAAIELEGLAMQSDCVESYKCLFESPHSPSHSGDFVIDTRLLTRAIVDDTQRRTSVSVIARRFHNSLTNLVEHACHRIRDQTRLDRVVLSGGVFLNSLLNAKVAQQLSQRGFSVFCHQAVPAGDGGLCLGQLAIAARRQN